MPNKTYSLNHLANVAGQFILNRFNSGQLLNAAYSKKNDGNGAPWERQAQVVEKKVIKDMINAIMGATDPDNPRRGELMRFYNTCKSDLHLASCIDNRILPIQCANFKLTDKDGNADTEAKK
ncbi:MAG: hypothetical protein PF444_10095, partial [Bacteroidales bacterium]|nr:hypothetical protein [Bacteroidales bacterium]